MAHTKLTARKTTGGKAKQFAGKAFGKTTTVTGIVKKAAVSPSLKTLKNLVKNQSVELSGRVVSQNIFR